jgi:hypothetical protein
MSGFANRQSGAKFYLQFTKKFEFGSVLRKGSGDAEYQQSDYFFHRFSICLRVSFGKAWSFAKATGKIGIFDIPKCILSNTWLDIPHK